MSGGLFAAFVPLEPCLDPYSLFKSFCGQMQAVKCYCWFAVAWVVASGVLVACVVPLHLVGVMVRVVKDKRKSPRPFKTRV